MANVGDQVKIKPTGDEEIDVYVDQVGTVTYLESEQLEDLNGHWRTLVHHFVTMPSGTVIVINEDEFNAV